MAEEHDGGDPLDWLRSTIPGEPGVDYPIYGSDSFSLSSFSCSGRVSGVYYADSELRCQVSSSDNATNFNLE